MLEEMEAHPPPDPLEADELATVRFRQATLFDTLSEGVLATDAEGRITDWNPGAERMFGYTRQEALGRSPEFFHEPDLDGAVEREILCALTQVGRWSGEIRFRRKDGSNGIAETVVVAQYDDQGRRIAHLGVNRDVTERKEMEERLRQAHKMEAVGRLAGGVARDFNNLLTVIRGNVEMALLELAPSSPLRADLEQVRQAAESASSLTRQLLTFSRRQAHEPRVVELNRVVESSARLLQRLLGAGIDVTTSLAEDAWPVRVDPGQMEQLLMNLAVNARDAMPQGGTLRMETHNHEVEARRSGRRPGVNPGRYVVLTVADTGIGMDEKTREQAFEPFFTTKGKATGLGLSTVYGIVQQSGGFIEVKSEPSAGTVFRIHLPRVESTEPAIQAEEARTPPVGGGETILLVDDEASVRMLARRLLERIGYQVVEACDGEEALRVAAGQPGDIHLLLTDLTMPRMGGRELALRMGDERPRTRVVFMSGYTDGAALPESIGGVPTAFIAKPFTIHILASTVRRALDEETWLEVRSEK